MQVRHADACRRVFPVDPENSLVKPLLVKPALYNVRASDNVRLVQKPLSVVLQLRPEFSLVWFAQFLFSSREECIGCAFCVIGWVVLNAERVDQSSVIKTWVYLFDSTIIKEPSKRQTTVRINDVMRTDVDVTIGCTDGRRCCFIAELSGRFSSCLRRRMLLLSDMFSYLPALDTSYLFESLRCICTLILRKH